MAVNPVAFSGMIQNTHDLTSAKTQGDLRPATHQAQMADITRQEANQSTQQVADTKESARDTFESSEGGDGTGYEGNKGKKKNSNNDNNKKPRDGVVINKSGTSSFDLSI